MVSFRRQGKSDIDKEEQRQGAKVVGDGRVPGKPQVHCRMHITIWYLIAAIVFLTCIHI